jgi:hypothetical protein
MQLPITRNKLQAYNPFTEDEELLKQKIDTYITATIDALCKDLMQNMRNNYKEKKYVWRNLASIRQVHIQLGLPRAPEDYLPIFIEKLKAIFLDCDIIIDPLKTYLIIDWS